MLKQRVITAIIMLAIVIPTLITANAWPFCLLSMLFMTAGAWEWARMNGLQGAKATIYAGIFASGALAIWYANLLNIPMLNLWVLASGAWVLVSAWLLSVGAVGWAKISASIRQVVGLLALWVAWLAVAQARVQGVNFLMSIMCLVWVADSFAYFVGRTWGGRFTKNKLAPTISPGKSWEGVWGGVAGVLLLAGFWIWADVNWGSNVTSIYSQLNSQSWYFVLIALLFLTAMSVVGDLIESLIKRSAEVKDSSALLPGHGGVLDRVDALLPVLPIAMMLSALAAS